jgi:hypothetical protein
LDQVKTLLRQHPGSTPVFLCIEYPAGEKVFLDTDRSYKVTASEALVDALQRVLGEDRVYIAVSASPCRKPRRPRGHYSGDGGRSSRPNGKTGNGNDIGSAKH